ncbi:MAG: T9SS type A sorting domain-containing protein [Candidatus Cloacimonetes bacterium]|nr:T9SS type A sorting domain-containing protein [Candidatus Cloacimonadota bacterium]
MKIKLIFIIIILGFIPCISFSQIVNISNNSSESTHPYILDQNGIIYIFWNDYLNGNSDICFKYKQNNSWSETITIETSGNSRLFSVCSDSADVIHLLWREISDSSNRLKYGKIINSTLTDSSEIISYDSLYIISASLFIDNSDIKHISWDIIENDSIKIFYSSEIGISTWSSPQQLHEDYGSGFFYIHSQLIEDINYDLFCFWLSTDSNTISYIIKLDSTNWGSINYLYGQELGFGAEFVVRADDSLNIHLVSNHVYILTYANSLYYTKWDGLSWSEVEYIPSMDLGCAPLNAKFHPDLVFTSENFPFVCWDQYVFDYNFTLRGNWVGSAIKLNSGWHANGFVAKYRKPLYPKISIDNNDLINFVWQDSTDGDYDIYYTTTVSVFDIDQNENFYQNQIQLFQNYPNPFNLETIISFNLNKNTNVLIEVYNIRGQKVKTIVDKYMTFGYHTANFNTEDMKNGIYFYKLSTKDKTFIKKMILMR